MSKHEQIEQGIARHRRASAMSGAPGQPQSAEPGRLYQLGCRFSEWASDLSAHPFAQLGVIIFCVAWFAFGLTADLLTAALSILAITLSQMVLNRQNEREADAHRRDVAMHAKLDELLIASRRARNDLAGIEDLPEEVIAEIKQERLAAASEEADEANRRLPAASSGS
ncbi:low affinity iron permease family protein [Sphingomonas sp. G124]|uniref:Low affinity iron permease family protein n=1 Tax=Sphingomonas cremea TaxID=2904799 RepID=A0A9X1QNA3_9SPHN|nr:low affinity iron permease family protein [Sphingomonas cremea]MCF2515841.1 low affinity iron permease family protein [Sphingomonas cremea]